jgi:hypothetical protein
MANRYRRDDDQDQDQDQKQDQDQDQKQAELQAQAQAQLEAQGQLQGQGQGQGQAQGQGQLQGAVQLVGQGAFQESDNKNDNENDNDNKNENTNNLDNKVDSSVDNKVSNEVDNKVNVDVDIDVDLKIDSPPEDNDVIDIDHLDMDEGMLLINPDEVDQKLDDGVNFNVDQINMLMDNDKASDSKVSFDVEDSKADDKGSSGFTFSIDTKAEGGDAKIDDITTTLDDGTVGDIGGASSAADASVSAFNQSIVLGANIQFNSLDAQFIGNDGYNSYAPAPVETPDDGGAPA